MSPRDTDEFGWLVWLLEWLFWLSGQALMVPFRLLRELWLNRK